MRLSYSTITILLLYYYAINIRYICIYFDLNARHETVQFSTIGHDEQNEISRIKRSLRVVELFASEVLMEALILLYY